MILVLCRTTKSNFECSLKSRRVVTKHDTFLGTTNASNFVLEANNGDSKVYVREMVFEFTLHSYYSDQISECSNKNKVGV